LDLGSLHNPIRFHAGGSDSSASAKMVSNIAMAALDDVDAINWWPRRCFEEEELEKK